MMDTERIERSEKVDLGFGLLTLRIRGFDFEGRRGSRVRKNGIEEEVERASGRFHISADNLIRMLGGAYFESIKDFDFQKGILDQKKDEEEQLETQEAKAEEDTEVQEMQVAEEKEAEERKKDEKSNEVVNQTVQRRRIRGESFKMGEMGEATVRTVCNIIPRRQSFPGVRLVVIQSKFYGNGNGEVIARTTGVLTPFRLMSVLDVLGSIIRQNTQIYSYPLGAAVLVVSSERISFQSGTVQTFLEKWHEKELKYLLTGKFFAPERIKVNFRAGRVRIEESEEGISLIFRNSQSILSPEDLFVLWAVLK